MKTIRFLLAAIGLFTAALSVPAASMTIFSPVQAIAGGTNKVLVLTTNTYSGVVLSVENQENVAIQVSGSTILSNVANLTLFLRPSVDGTTFATTNLVTVTVAAATNANTGAIFCVVTNIACPGIRSFGLTEIGNTGGIAIPTNLTVTYGIKR